MLRRAPRWHPAGRTRARRGVARPRRWRPHVTARARASRGTPSRTTRVKPNGASSPRPSPPAPWLRYELPRRTSSVPRCATPRRRRPACEPRGAVRAWRGRARGRCLQPPTAKTSPRLEPRSTLRGRSSSPESGTGAGSRWTRGRAWRRARARRRAPRALWRGPPPCRTRRTRKTRRGAREPRPGGGTRGGARGTLCRRAARRRSSPCPRRRRGMHRERHP